MRLRRLYPEPGTIELERIASALALGERAPAGRPYVIVNFATTADGRATVDGRSGPIGDEVDHALFLRLRTQVDAVLAGTATLRIERYRRLVRDPELRAARQREGLAPEPLACVVSHGVEIASQAPIFGEAGQPIALYTWSHDPLPDVTADVTVIRLDTDQPGLAPVLADLRTRRGVSSLLCEGGPTLFSSLLREGLADELFLTLAPTLAGGEERSLTTGPALSAPARLRLLWALEHDASLFLRYAIEV